MNKNDILIATDVAARGLDLPDVGLIVHYNLPPNIENYIHRSGRTARINKEGTCISIVGPGDTKSLAEIEKIIGKKIEKLKIDEEKNMKSREVVTIAKEIAEGESQNIGNSKFSSWKCKAAEALGLENADNTPEVSKKQINNLKKILKKVKADVSLPKKRCSVITPEIFKQAKQNVKLSDTTTKPNKKPKLKKNLY